MARVLWQVVLSRPDRQTATSLPCCPSPSHCASCYCWATQIHRLQGTCAHAYAATGPVHLPPKACCCVHTSTSVLPCTLPGHVYPQGRSIQYAQVYSQDNQLGHGAPLHGQRPAQAVLLQFPAGGAHQGVHIRMSNACPAHTGPSSSLAYSHLRITKAATVHGWDQPPPSLWVVVCS
jgi:hypothetical protein